MPSTTNTPNAGTSEPELSRRRLLLSRLPFLAVFGPGLVVMLADTDVGSIITAGQSGVQWGYKLLLVQLVLVPVLYIVQELTVRLGIFTGRGHGELIREAFGPGWALAFRGWPAVATIGALLTEFSGVAGIGDLYGVPHYVSLPLAVVALLAVVLTGSYRRVERVAIVVGLFEFAFFFVAWAAQAGSACAWCASRSPSRFSIANYEYLVAANIGAVIMPWMIFYQQSAIADKKLGAQHYAAREMGYGDRRGRHAACHGGGAHRRGGLHPPACAAGQPLHRWPDEPGDDAVSRPADRPAGVRPRGGGGRAWSPPSSPPWLWPGGWARWRAISVRWNTGRCRPGGFMRSMLSA